jgi:KTSC domain
MPSTVIAAMHYNAESRVLTIVYRGKRGTYRYFDVPPEEYAAFRAAPSKGRYLNEVFKIHGYRYERERNAAA